MKVYAITIVQGIQNLSRLGVQVSQEEETLQPYLKMGILRNGLSSSNEICGQYNFDHILKLCDLKQTPNQDIQFVPWNDTNCSNDEESQSE